MDCTAARTAWHDRCDGQLEAAQAAALDVHLLDCAACRRFVEEMNALDAGFAALRAESEAALEAHSSGARTRPAVPRTQPVHIHRPFLAPAERGLAFRRVAQFAVAAAVLLAAGLAFYSGATGDKTARPQIAVRGGTPLPSGTRGGSPALGSDSPRIVLTGVSADAFLLVEEKSPDPRVHIYSLHAIYQATDDGAAAQTALAAAGSEPGETGL